MLFIRPRGAGEGDHAKHGGGGFETKVRFVVDAASTILSASALWMVLLPRFAGQDRIIVPATHLLRPSFAKPRRSRVGKGATRRAHVFLLSFIRVGFACAQPTLQSFP
jgi:hypothetical protein